MWYNSGEEPWCMRAAAQELEELANGAEHPPELVDSSWPQTQFICDDFSLNNRPLRALPQHGPAVGASAKTLPPGVDLDAVGSPNLFA